MKFNAKHYDQLYPNREGEIEFLLKYLKGKTVLDIGGGTGIISEALNKKGFECDNLEPQKDMVEVAEKRGIKTHHTTIENMEMPIIYDNAIMVFDVFNFLENPGKAFYNISKLLKGRLIFTYWNYDVRKSGWDFNWKLKRITRKKWDGDQVTIDFWFPFWHERHKMMVCSHGMIKGLLHKYGFKEIERIKGKYITKIVATNEN
jgi:SAM-dependent methyltransferase